MEKRNSCTTCVHRTDQELCECWQIQTFDYEHCRYYEEKKEFLDELAKWCAIVIMLFVALCFIFTLPGCADAKVGTYREPDKYMERTRFIGSVNDKPGPAITEPEETEAEAEPDPKEKAEVVAEDEEVAPKEEASAEEKPSVASFPETASHSVLTKAGGVNYFNNMRETWYSSNVLRHYRIDEWQCGDDGVWRDKDGYIIIASSDFPMGTMHQTSLGLAKVYDTGCPSGTVDIYVNW